MKKSNILGIVLVLVYLIPLIYFRSLCSRYTTYVDICAQTNGAFGLPWVGIFGEGFGNVFSLLAFAVNLSILFILGKFIVTTWQKGSNWKILSGILFLTVLLIFFGIFGIAYYYILPYFYR